MALQSNFRSNKLFFESLFFTEWQDTPIHFAGQEFAVDGIKEWVNPFFNPIGGRFTGVSTYLTENHANFSVVCWSDTDSNVMELADKVVAFVSEKAIAYRLNGYEVTDHAWHDSNSVYIFLTFDIKMYGGGCTSFVDCSLSVGDTSAQKYNLTGLWKKECSIFKM